MADRLSQAMEAFVRSIFGQRLDYLAAYPSKAVQQNADGTLELVPDDSRLPTFKQVPIRYGVPGVSATVAAGARVLLEFAGADPRKPIATVWESASVSVLVVEAAAIKLGADADASIMRGDDAKTAYDIHLHNFVGLPPGVSGVTLAPTVPMPASALASKGKVK